VRVPGAVQHFSLLSLNPLLSGEGGWGES